MSTEREINTPSGKSQVLDFSQLSDEQLEKELATVLFRGQVNARLDVPLPENVHGEWVLNDPLEISRKQGLGFQIDDKYAIANKLHSDGTGKPIIGDVIFMTCDKRVKQVIDKLAAKKYEEMNGKRKREKEQEEEKSFNNSVRREGYINADPSITKTSSTAEVIDGNVIAAAKQASLAERLNARNNVGNPPITTGQ